MSEDLTIDQLRKLCDEKGVKYDGRWREPRLLLLLEEAKEEEKPATEDTPEIGIPPSDPADDDETTPARNQEDETVQELRKGAIIALEMEKKRKEVRAKRHGRGAKGKVDYVKALTDRGAEVYEKETGKFIRVYTLEDHGDGFEALADKFIESRR